MRLHNCQFCRDCIDRAIVLAMRIDEVLSAPRNHEQERQRIIELLRMRERMVEEAHRMGIGDGTAG